MHVVEPVSRVDPARYGAQRMGGALNQEVPYTRKEKPRGHVTGTWERHREAGPCELSVNDRAAPTPGSQSWEAPLRVLRRTTSEPGRNRGGRGGAQNREPCGQG